MRHIFARDGIYCCSVNKEDGHLKTKYHHNLKNEENEKFDADSMCTRYDNRLLFKRASANHYQNRKQYKIRRYE